MKKSPGCQLSSVDSISSCSPCENLSPMSLHTISEWPCAGRVTAHAVTLSSPSPVLFLTAKAPQGALVTHVSVADSDKQSNTEPSVSNVLQDVHIVRTQELLSLRFLSFFFCAILTGSISHNA